MLCHQLAVVLAQSYSHKYQLMLGRFKWHRVGSNMPLRTVSPGHPGTRAVAKQVHWNSAVRDIGLLLKAGFHQNPLVKMELCCQSHLDWSLWFLLPLYQFRAGMLYESCPEEAQVSSVLPDQTSEAVLPTEPRYLRACYFNLDSCMLFPLLGAGRGLSCRDLEWVFSPPISNVFRPVDIAFRIELTLESLTSKKPKHRSITCYRNVDCFTIPSSLFHSYKARIGGD